jgi:hypothetical protein
VRLRPRTVHRPAAPPISRLIFVSAAACLLLHLAGSGRYGFFRDELYYIACGNHLATGYVDQPPLVALIARLSSLAFGNTLSGFRFFPGLVGACLVAMTGWMTRELGGGRFAQALASVATLLAPLYLAFGSFLSMNAFEPLFWLTCAYILVRILKGSDERLWLAFGAVAGIGLQNKHTMLVFGLAVMIGMTLSREYRPIRSKWFWAGGILAFLIFLPNLIWEAQRHWPQIESVRNCQALKNTPVGVLRFLGEQLIFFNPLASIVIVAGLAWLLVSRDGRRFRCLGWAYLVIMAIVILLRGKTYYPAPFYSILFAAGSVELETRFLTHKYRLAYSALIVISGLIMLPFGVPILPLKTLLRYQDVIQMQNVVTTERDSAGELHQLYADMLGWENMVATISEVYHRLPPSERNDCAILASNYGEAGAIDIFGAQYGLPKAISAHNNYYLWGTRGYTGRVAIVLGSRAGNTVAMFDTVEQAATISATRTAISENHLPVYVCRRPRAPLKDIWPSLRHFE